MRLGHYLALLYFICNLAACHALNAIWAVNCGGNAHVDLNGVKYDADFNVRGIPSGHGLNLIMHRAPVEDAVLYQTERYDTSTFSYEFPMPESGSYVLHLKFSEVWFQIPNGKVGYSFFCFHYIVYLLLLLLMSHDCQSRFSLLNLMVA